jgi:hypothetical protein
MAAPNIVNVTTITGVTTYRAGVSTQGSGDGIKTGVTTIVSNASGSNKVLKINILSAAGIGNTTGVTVYYHDNAAATSAASTVSIARTVSVPTFSSLVVISKDNPLYLEENRCITAVTQSNTGGRIDIICSYEDIS